MKKNLQRAFALLFLSLLAFSCSNLLSKPVAKMKSDVVRDGYSKEFAQYPKTKTLGIKWNKYAVDNEIMPVFPVNGSVNSSDSSICDPCVLKDGNGYRMWFTRITIEDQGLKRKKYSLGYAYSPDGTNWTENTISKQTVPEIKAAHGLSDVRISSVLYDKKNRIYPYRMWFLGKKDKSSQTGWELYYAYTSSIDDNTAKWKVERFYTLHKSLGLSTNGFDNETISRAYVIGDKHSGYKMWYGGHKGAVRKIGYAASQEGTYKWTKKNVIVNPGFAAKALSGSPVKKTFDDSSVEYPCVIKDKDIYKMWYSGYSTPWSIGLAYSLDGENFIYYDNVFEEQSGNPVLKPEAFWEGQGIMNCSVISDKTGNNIAVYKMWYTAQGNDGKYRIGYAESFQ